MAERHPSAVHIQDKNQQVFREPRLRGTPAMLIGDSVIPGYAAYATLEKAVQQALEKASTNRLYEGGPIL